MQHLFQNKILHLSYQHNDFIETKLYNGVNVAQWLSTLEDFTRAFYKNFTIVDLKGIKHYLLKRILNRNFTDLGVMHMIPETTVGYVFLDCGSTMSVLGTHLEVRSWF